MFIVKHRTIFFTLSGLIVLGSILAMFMYGFNYGIDFKGGSILEVQYATARPDMQTVQTEVASAGVTNATVSPVNTDSYNIEALQITDTQKVAVMQALSLDAVGNPIQVTVVQFNSIGPSVGKELANKAYVAIAVVILCIVLFIMFAFRRLKNPLNYGLATIIALAHDVIIPTGVYIVFIHITNGQIDLLFVTALLAILGYSVHDTIVVFDRVRENLLKRGGTATGDAFEQVVGESVQQTFGRSINTSLTIFLVLLALYFIGGQTTHNFAFVLLIGVITGTYSSIFVASPLLVTLEGWRNKGKK
jgi:preprotein translocase subunit SecF